MIKLDVYSDYVCPWCYVAQGIVARLKREYELEVDWKPFFLHSEVPDEGIPIRGQLLQRFAGLFNRLHNVAQDNGLSLVIPRILPNTRRCFEAAEYARKQNRHEDFHHIVFRMYYGEGLDIGQWEVLRKAAEEAGLNSDEMQQQTERGDFQDILNERLNNARAINIDVAPTFIVADKLRIEGVQSYSHFQRLLNRL